MTRQKKYQVIVDMSLSNQEANQLRVQLNRNRTLSPTSKTSLNNFINKKNAFDRATFMQQFNAKLRNLRGRDASFKRKRVRGNNLNSAMENNTGSVSNGSVNLGKRGRNSPRGVLSAASAASAASGVSSTSNEESTGNSGPRPMSSNGYGGFSSNNENNRERNAKRRKNNSRSQIPLTVAQAASRAANAANAKAAANKAAANKAAANKAAANKAAANKAVARNRVPLVNLKAKRKAAAAAAQAANAATARANANAKAAANKARANANAARAKAATPVNSVRNSVTNIGNGGGSIENNASSPVIIAANRNGKTKKNAILLEIIKMSRRTINMAKNNRNGFLKLMPTVNNVNSILEYHTYTWALLYDIISTIDGTKFTALQITPKTLKDIHKKLMVKNTYTTGRSTGGMGNRQERVFNFTDEEVVEFLFLIWLDGNHDQYIRESFKDWLDDTNSNAVYFTNRHRELAKKFVNEFPDPRKYINNVPKFSKANANKEREEFITQALRNVKGYETICKICIETKSVWFFVHSYNGDPERKHTQKNKLQTSVKMGFGTFSSGTPSKTSLANNFETILKMGIEKILDIKQSDYIYTGTWEINKLKQGNMIHEVSLDQESGDKILSKTITNTPKFRPYITTASLIDPGKHMLVSGAGSTDRLLLLNAMKKQNMNFLDNLQCHYHIGPVKFVIRNGGLNFLKVDLSIRKGGPPIKREGSMPTLDFFQLKINETNQQSGEIIQGGIKKNATNPPSKMGKFMGDALQYMTVSVQNTYRKKPRFFASGDGSACFMNAYFCHKLNIPLRLIIDTGVGNIRSTGLQNNT